MEVHYGANGKFTSPRTFTGGVDCGNSVFTDPIAGVRKWCEKRAVTTAVTTVNDNTLGTSSNQFQYVGSGWTTQSCVNCYLGQNHLSANLNDYALFRFNGTQIKAYGTKGPSMGIVAYSVDGGAETLVDLYASARQDQQLLFTSPVLASGAHTLKIRVTHTKNALANYYGVIVDKAVASG